MGDGDVQDQAHPMGVSTEGGGCRPFSGCWRYAEAPGSECCVCPADATSPSCPRPIEMSPYRSMVLFIAHHARQMN
eukprot:765991-Hanusia_phi.AAC.1